MKLKLENQRFYPDSPAVSVTTSGAACVTLRDSSGAAVPTGSATSPIVVVGTTPRLSASYTRAADATGAYADGDMIGNTTTAASVVPITWTLSRASGRITGARCTLAAASGTIVLPAFDLLLFRPEANLPFAAGSYPADNAALNITAAAMRELVGVLSFTATGWRNQAGANTAAGGHVWQRSTFAMGPSGAAFVPFNLTGLAAGNVLRGIMQARSTWNPGNVAQQFDFVLDADLDA